MKRLLAISLLIPFQVFGQNAEQILHNAVKAAQQHQSVSYDVHYTLKGVDDPDTTYYTAKVSLQKTPESIGMFRIDMADQSVVYDQENVSYTKKGGKVQRNPVKNYTGETWPNTSPFYSSRFLWKEFLQRSLVEFYLSESKVTRLDDTIINGESCYQVQIAHAKDKAKKFDDDWNMLLCISHKDYVPLYRRIIETSNARNQYEAIVLTNYTFDKVDKAIFEAGR